MSNNKNNGAVGVSGGFLLALLLAVYAEKVIPKAEKAWNGFWTGVGTLVGDIMNFTFELIGYYIFPFAITAAVLGSVLAFTCRISERDFDPRIASPVFAGLILCAWSFLGSPGSPSAAWSPAAWLGLLVGAPIVFLLWAKPLQQDADEKKEAIVRSPLETQLTQQGLETRDLKVKCNEQKAQIGVLEEEMKKLKERDRYLTEKKKHAAGEKSGILDSDEF